MSENFIRQYDGVVSDQNCDDLIHFFEVSAQHTKYTRNDVSKVSDTAVAITPWDRQSLIYNTACPPVIGAHEEFMQNFWQCFENYKLEFQTVDLDSSQLSIFDFKMQRTRPGEGYHIWHHEKTAHASGNRRCLTWILFLNDVDDGGELEFIYYHQRVKPKKGTLILFPVSFTHTHRGNPPLNNDKYIATGWVEYS